MPIILRTAASLCRVHHRQTLSELQVLTDGAATDGRVCMACGAVAVAGTNKVTRLPLPCLWPTK